MSSLEIEALTVRYGTLGGNEEEVYIVVLPGQGGWYWFTGINEVADGAGPASSRRQALREALVSAIELPLSRRVKGLYPVQWIEYTDYGTQVDGVYPEDEGFEHDFGHIDFERFLEECYE